MQYKLGAPFGQHAAKARRIRQSLEKAPRRTFGRMMDEDDAEICPGLLECIGKARKLALAETPRRHERARRYGGRERDQRDIAAAAYEWKSLDPVVAAHIVAPERGGRPRSGSYIGVMIAGNDRDVAWVTERLQPLLRLRILRRLREVDQIARHGDVVGRLSS